MKTSPRARLARLLSVLALTPIACGDAASDDAGGAASTQVTSASSSTSTSISSATGADPFAGCAKGTLEADFAPDLPLTGPGIDPEDGTLAAGTYFVAATYLAVIPEQMDRVKQLGGEVVGGLMTAPGLVAFSAGGSASCASLRTLTVWRSEEDMLAFVVSPAHTTAMLATPDVSRGTSNTISWEGSEATASWSESATRLGAEIGGDR